MKQTLFEMSEAYNAVYARDDLDDQTWLDTMEAIEADWEDKADAYQTTILMLKGDVATIDEQIKRLQAMKKAKKNRADGLRERLMTAMVQTNQTKFKTGLFSYSVRETKSVNPDIAISDVPSELVITSARVDKTAVMDRYKETGEFADLIETKTAVHIR